MSNSLIAIIVSVAALLTSAMVFPWALKFALRHKIVDNPNARKLQRRPVPVFGGVVVYSGILVGGIILSLFIHSEVLIWGMVAMTIMMLIGIWDDLRDISALLRLFIEVALVSSFIAITGVYIDSFHGFWGLYELDPWFAIPFSIFAGVGTINAVNLIDGVDGYSSGYGMLACGCFALAFGSVWSISMVCMSLVVIAALFPFFLHNVFGVRTRMFIGDGGTLMLGMVMVIMVFYSLWSGSGMCKLVDRGLSLVGLVLAVGCIPIFDTIRVMSMRMLRGQSPFKPDRTHLHHLFIDMGFSHLGAALFILLINLLVICVLLLSWKLGASIDVQTYISIALGVIVTFGFYKLMRCHQNSGPLDEEGYPQGTKLWHVMCKLGDKTHREQNPTWSTLTKIMDGTLG